MLGESAGILAQTCNMGYNMMLVEQEYHPLLIFRAQLFRLGANTSYSFRAYDVHASSCRL